MKKIIWIMPLVLLLVVPVWAKDFTLTKKAGDLNVVVRMDKNPPVVGKNTVLIEIKDKSGKAVSDGKVAIDYGMPAMPGMPAMNYKADTMLHGNAYHATLNLSMSGSWNVIIKINRAGKTVNTRFSVDAQ